MKIRTFILIMLVILLLALNACGRQQTPPIYLLIHPLLQPPPFLNYVAALYLMQGGSSISCTGSEPVEATVVPPLGYSNEDERWKNESVEDAAIEYCSMFPTAIPDLISCL